MFPLTDGLAGGLTAEDDGLASGSDYSHADATDYAEAWREIEAQEERKLDRLVVRWQQQAELDWPQWLAREATATLAAVVADETRRNVLRGVFKPGCINPVPRLHRPLSCRAPRARRVVRRRTGSAARSDDLPHPLGAALLSGGAA